MNEPKPPEPSTPARGMGRSPVLLDRARSALLVVDFQEKLLPSIRHRTRIEWNIGRLIDGARLLGVATEATEQYPQGLGPTASSLRERLGTIPQKTMFSCRQCAEIFERWSDAGIDQVVLCGIEAHVCILQTALDLIAMGFDVYVAVDATGSRFELDEQVGLQRIALSGGTLATTESILFEWCETASAAEFKQISALVRESAPAAPPPPMA
jgi:isochorismate hydrolase